MSRRNAIKSLSHLTRPRVPSAQHSVLPTILSAAMSSSAQRQPTRPTPSASHNLSRFLTVQNTHENYTHALSEIRAGRKQSHWMWYIFPQIAGLAAFPSPAARHYALSSGAEARAYLGHPVLGPRLWEISRAVLAQGSEVGDAAELMGSEVDKVKLRSCMTLFKRVVDGLREEERRQGDEVFAAVLDRFSGGVEDAKTVEKLEEERRRG